MVAPNSTIFMDTNSRVSRYGPQHNQLATDKITPLVTQNSIALRTRRKVSFVKITQNLGEHAEWSLIIWNIKASFGTKFAAMIHTPFHSQSTTNNEMSLLFNLKTILCRLVYLYFFSTFSFWNLQYLMCASEPTLQTCCPIEKLFSPKALLLIAPQMLLNMTSCVYC